MYNEDQYDADLAAVQESLKKVLNTQQFNNGPLIHTYLDVLRTRYNAAVPNFENNYGFPHHGGNLTITAEGDVDLSNVGG